MSLRLVRSGEEDASISEEPSVPPKTSGIRHVSELVRPPALCEACAKLRPEANLCRACAAAYRSYQISLLVVASELRHK